MWLEKKRKPRQFVPTTFGQARRPISKSTKKNRQPEGQRFF
ncbi:hypothetical protein Z946_1332 [Sulfitobacter noctilucicola]|nr:hypothetical protein Z946_1332 [Sulfitobacter noctilucicola]